MRNNNSICLVGMRSLNKRTWPSAHYANAEPFAKFLLAFLMTSAVDLPGEALPGC